MLSLYIKGSLTKFILLLSIFILVSCGGGNDAPSDSGKDTTPPTIILNGTNPLSLNQGDNYIEPGATANDDVDGNVPVTITGTVDTSTPGTYSITYSATDSAKNTSSATRTINIIASQADTTPPVINLNGANPMTLNKGYAYVEPGATAIDNVDGDISNTIIITGSVDINTPGNYTITYSVTDAANNTSSADRTVTVTVDSPPTASNLNTAEAFTEDDAAFDLAAIVIQDPDSTNVTVTLSLSNTNAGSLSTGMSGTVASTFVAGIWSASGPVANVNALLSNVQFDPAENFDQTFNIDTAVTDGPNTLSGSKTVTVTPVNDAPQFNPGLGNQAHLEGTAVSVDASATDVESTTLVYTASGLPPGLNIDTNSGQITGTVEANASLNSPYSVDLSVNDQSGEANATTHLTINWTVTNMTFDPGAGFNKARGPDRSVNVIAVATDGSGDVYVGGRFTSFNETAVNQLVRLNNDASVDTGFDLSNGGANDVVWAIAPAVDGSGDIYVGGSFTRFNGTAANRLVRLNSDGSVDTAFELGIGANNTVYVITPAADGSGDVYVAGDFTSFNGVASNHLARLNNDGSVDTDFDLTSGGADNTIYSIALATDGSGDAYVGGAFANFNGMPSNYLVRLNSDGSVDTGFDHSASGINNTVRAIAPATDDSGDVYVGGNFTNYIFRFNSDGSVDSGFNRTLLRAVWSIVPVEDGSGAIYVGGDGMMSRFNSDGSLGKNYAVGGFVSYSSVGIVSTIVQTTDGSGDVYLGGGFTRFSGAVVNYLVRMNSDGTMDYGFDLRSGGTDNSVKAIAPAIDGSGDVYVGGLFTRYNSTPVNYLVRLNSDGTVDSGFNLSSGGANSWVYAIAPAADGSGDVYVGGIFTRFNGRVANRLVRLNSDGSVDTSFDLSSGGANLTVYAIAPAGDGSGDIYVGGTFTSFNGQAINRLARLNSDGSIDTGFDLCCDGLNSGVKAIASASDGSGDVYVGGATFDSFNGITVNSIVRLNSDTSLDTGFVSGTALAVYAIAPALDGSGDVYIGGGFTDYDGKRVYYLARANNDGSVDTGFGVSNGGANNAVWAIAPATDGSGDVYVGGPFTRFNGTTMNHIVRLNSDGSLDSTFDLSRGGANNIVSAIALAADGSGDVFVGGSFTNFNGTTTGSLVRLNADGSVD